MGFETTMTRLTTTWLAGADRRGPGFGTVRTRKARGPGNAVSAKRVFSRKVASGAKLPGRGFRRESASVSHERRLGCAESWLKGASGSVVDPSGMQGASGLTLPDVSDGAAYMKKYAPKGIDPLFSTPANDQLKDRVLTLGDIKYKISVSKDYIPT